MCHWGVDESGMLMHTCSKNAWCVLFKDHSVAAAISASGHCGRSLVLCIGRPSWPAVRAKWATSQASFWTVSLGCSNAFSELANRHTSS